MTGLERLLVPQRRLPLLACLIVLLTLALSCRDPQTALTGLEEARGQAASLRVEFGKAADASNRAVMADTDDASIAFAREADEASRTVEERARTLHPLLQRLGFSDEIKVLSEFNARFSEYRKLDKNILKLAGENTNLKAQAMSFGPANQAAAKFRDALRSVVASYRPQDHCRVDGLAAQALLAVREIQVRQAPHIAERDDAPMTRMEKEMADLDATARAALKSLSQGAPPEAGPALTDALSALDRFKAASDEIVVLSRRNTNVVSLDLALRKRPPLFAACDERLRTLQDALAKQGPKATR